MNTVIILNLSALIINEKLLIPKSSNKKNVWVVNKIVNICSDIFILKIIYLNLIRKTETFEKLKFISIENLKII